MGLILVNKRAGAWEIPISSFFLKAKHLRECHGNAYKFFCMKI